MRRYRMAKPTDEKKWRIQSSQSMPKKRHSKPNFLFSAIKQLAQSSRYEPSFTQPLQSFFATPQAVRDNFFGPPPRHKSQPRPRYEESPGQLSAPLFSQQKSRYQPTSYMSKGGQMGMSMGLPSRKPYFSAAHRQQHRLEESALNKFREASNKKSSGHSLVVNQTIENALLNRNEERKKQFKRIASPRDDLFDFELPGDSKLVEPRRHFQTIDREPRQRNPIEQKRPKQTVVPMAEASIQTDRVKKRALSFSRIQGPGPIKPTVNKKQTISKDQSSGSKIKQSTVGAAETKQPQSALESTLPQTPSQLQSVIVPPQPKVEEKMLKKPTTTHEPVLPQTPSQLVSAVEAEQPKMIERVPKKSDPPQPIKQQKPQRMNPTAAPASNPKGSLSDASKQFLKKHSQKNPSTKPLKKPKQPTTTTSKPASPKNMFKKFEEQQIEEVDIGGLPSTLGQSKPIEKPSTVPPAPPKQSKLKEQAKEASEELEEGPLLDRLFDIIEMIEEIGAYRQQSKPFYQNRPSDLQSQYKVSSYYTAHQFHYFSVRSHTILSQETIDRQFHSLSPKQLQVIQKSDDFLQELDRLEENITDSKKLLKACYQICKAHLPPADRILHLDAKTNHHRNCINSLSKEFQTLWTLHRVSPNDSSVVERCIYLIELSLALRGLNGEEVSASKGHLRQQNPVGYLTANKNLLLPN